MPGRESPAEQLAFWSATSRRYCRCPWRCPGSYRRRCSGQCWRRLPPSPGARRSLPESRRGPIEPATGCPACSSTTLLDTLRSAGRAIPVVSHCASASGGFRAAGRGRPRQHVSPQRRLTPRNGRRELQVSPSASAAPGRCAPPLRRLRQGAHRVGRASRLAARRRALTTVTKAALHRQAVAARQIARQTPYGSRPGMAKKAWGWRSGTCHQEDSTMSGVAWSRVSRYASKVLACSSTEYRLA